MPSDGYSLGIDFGTSNTVAVGRAADGRTRTLLVDGSPLLPSAIYAERDGGLVVGRDALYSARLDPARFEPNPKRRIDDGTVLLGDREVPVVELIAAVLARVAEEWTRTMGPVGAQTTLTCPAVWGATRREVLAEAARKAGLGEVRLVVEPVAAATYFAQVLAKEVPVGSVVVVHDFGAGTFDASVVARTASGFEVLAVDGRDDLGGIDVDAAVVEHLGNTYQPRFPEAWDRLTNPSTVEERRAKRQLWDDVRAAKERLSRHPSADLLIPLADTEAHLTRPELEVLAEPILAQAVHVTEALLGWAGLAEGRIAGVFLVGGSSRIPLMSTQLFRALGEAPVVIEQPELVVAEGSILAGALTVGVEAPAAPGPSTGLLPRIPADAWGSAGPPSAVADSPAVPAPAAAAEAAPEVAAPVSPAPWVGRVQVPGAQPPGRRAPVAAVAPTRPFPALDVVASPAPHPTNGHAPGRQPPARPTSGGQPAGNAYRRTKVKRRGRFRRAVLYCFITLLLIAVPLIAAAVAYGLTTGEGLFPDGLQERIASYRANR